MEHPTQAAGPPTPPTAPTGTGATDALIEICREIRYEEIPQDILQVARQALLDWSGVALAGSREPLADILCDTLIPRSPEGGEGSPQAFSLVGRRQRAALLDAALINGATSHALDYDDTHTGMMGHPTVPVIPALLALAEAGEYGGRAFLTAYIAGVEAACRLGELLSSSHYEVGFHSTGTVGSFAAAAAGAHLLGLNRDGWRRALGLAGTQAAGLKASFGTMAKPLHAGRAAANGLLAVRLAAGGYTGHPAILEAHQGFAAAAHGGAADAARLGREPERYRIRDLLFKYHAACYLTHAAIEATRALRRDRGLRVEELRAVEVEVAPACLDACNIQDPSTGLEAKFSLRGTVTMALLDIDTGDLGSYREELVREPRFVAVRDRIRVVPGLDRCPTRSTVTAILDDGRKEQQSWDTGVPAADLDTQGQRLRAKFDALAGPILGVERAGALASAIGHFETLDRAADFAASLRPR